METYHPMECILDLIAASGPQDMSDCYTECRTQCTVPDHSSNGIVYQAKLSRVWDALITAGLCESDAHNFGGAPTLDLTEYGWEVMTAGGIRTVRYWDMAAKPAREHSAHFEELDGAKLFWDTLMYQSGYRLIGARPR